MATQLDEIELVRKAQLGDRQSLDRLAELAKVRLRVYVWRLTLQDDVTQDIVQETLLEMVRILGKLKSADRFWPWLYGIAINKLHRHHRTAGRIQNAERRTQNTEVRTQKSELTSRSGTETAGDNLVAQELKQIVSAAMLKLKTRHRAVLIMRCYDEMSYADIAQSIGRSEFATRMLFLRAKRALQKELLRNGFARGSLLAALVLFGKMTAPSEAAAATISVTAATTKVGFAAGLVGLATTKTAIVSLSAAGVLTAGAIVATSIPRSSMLDTRYSHDAQRTGHDNQEGQEYWYYFPDGPPEPIMTRIRSGANGQKSSWQLLQNDRGNYYYFGNTIYINNHRTRAADLGVARLPTDSPELSEFLTRVEGGGNTMEHVSRKGRGLLVVAAHDKDQSSDRSWVIRHYNVLDEDYFQSDWPAGVRTIDNRDAMHKRGWTYFRIDGQLNGEKVSGVGQMPFVYAASRQHAAWLKLRVGDALRIVDTGQDAYVYRSAEGPTQTYEAGAFFGGLARPWVGLHAIDIVRRDAARQKLWFQTTHRPGEKTAEVVVTCEQVRLIYTIDLETDVIDKMAFYISEKNCGYLQFSYLQDLAGLGGEFARPDRQSRSGSPHKNQGPLWLVQLAEGSLGK